MQRRQFMATMAAGSAALLASPHARAQGPGGAADYPAKPVKIIVPFATGGIADTFARLIAQHSSKDWEQPVVVENRSGAGGNIGADLVAKSAPDGYTLVMGSSGTHAVNVSLFPSMPYDPTRDFTPIASVVQAEGLLVVNPSVKATTVQELIALAKASPGRLAYGSGGLGTTSHLAGELFKYLTKTDLVHIPYKGNAEVMNDLIAGQTQLAFATMPTVLPFVRSDRLRAIAVIEKQRSTALPQIPTIAESGVPGFDVKNWIGLFGPAGLSPAITDKINAEVIRIMSLPEVAPQLTSAGARFAPATPAEFGRFTQDERRLWAGVIKEAHIKI